MLGSKYQYNVSRASPGTYASPGVVPFEPATPTQDRWLFQASCLLLLAYFYEIPVLRLPYGMLTWLRLDDLMMIPFLLTAAVTPTLLPGIGTTRTGHVIKLALVLMPFTVMLTFLTVSNFEATQRAAWTMAKYVEYFTVFLIVSRLHINRRRLTVLLTIALFGAVLNGMVGVGQYFGFISPQRLYGIYLSYSEFGRHGGIAAARTGEWDHALGLFTANRVLMGVFMCFGLAMVTFGIGARLGRGVKALALVVVVPITAGLVLSASRTGMAMAAVFFFVYSLLGKRRGITIGVLLLTVLIGGYVLRQDVTAGVAGRFEETLAEWEVGGGQLGGGRIRFFRSVLAHSLGNPQELLVGSGLCSFLYVHRDRVGATNAHNQYLELLAECGFGGLALFAAVHASLIGLLVRMMRRGADRCVRATGTILLAFHIAALCGAVGNPLFTPCPSMGSFLGFYQFWLGAAFAFSRDSVLGTQAPRR